MDFRANQNQSWPGPISFAPGNPRNRPAHPPGCPNRRACPPVMIDNPPPNTYNRKQQPSQWRHSRPPA